MNLPIVDRSKQMRRRETKMNQAKGSMERAQLHVAQLAKESASLQTQLQVSEVSLSTGDARLQARGARLAAAELVQTLGLSTTRQELLVAIEEPRVTAEELEHPKEMLLDTRLTLAEP
ncbi:MAG: hypothetical protein ACREF3_12945 [Acetobacteraceae bacterium]